MCVLIFQYVSSISSCPQADQVLPKVPIPYKRLSRPGLNNINKLRVYLTVNYPVSKIPVIRLESPHTLLWEPRFLQCIFITKTNQLMLPSETMALLRIIRHAQPANCVGKEQFLNATAGNADSNHSASERAKVQAITGFNHRAVHVRSVVG